MAGFSVASNEHLIRNNLWSKELKEILDDELMGMRYVRMLTDFPDGDTINIPSIGQPEVLDFDEGNAVRYSSMDTGNFTFSIDQYKQTAQFITEKFKQDSYYAQEVYSSFVPKQHRALMEVIEAKVLATGPDGQTASNLNTINGGDHRFVGSGTNETMSVKDFARAAHALKKGNAPMSNLVAIVDPSVTYALATQSNLVNLLTPQPQWGEVVKSGMTTGTKFKFNLYGFDVYESNYLKTVGAETIGGLTTASGAKANVLFSAAGGSANPFIGLVRQAPTVYSEFNKDLQREEVMTICRYGFKLFRPECLVTIITDTDQVA